MKKDTQGPATVALGGRRFTELSASELSVGQVLNYQRLYAVSGLSDLAMEEGEHPRAFALRILNDLIGAGVVLEMLGTLLVPQGRRASEWNVEMAEETAAFIGSLTSEEDKAAVQDRVLTTMLSFFEAGLISFWSSRRSSPEANQPETTERNEGTNTVH